MTERKWSDVDRYFTDLLVRPDPALAATLEASDAAGLPPISVADNQGKFLMLLALARGAPQRGQERGCSGRPPRNCLRRAAIWLPSCWVSLRAKRPPTRSDYSSFDW